MSVGLVLASISLFVSSPAQAAAVAVPLATAGSFSVLAGAGITNTGPTTVGGDIGSFPTASITGAATLTVGGTNHGGDLVTQGAKQDLVTAYNAAASQAPATPVVGDLGGQTLFGGVYQGVTLGLTGTVTLDGQGSTDRVFVFQSDSTLITGSASRVLLVNGASACNVFWQVGSSATVGTGTSFAGSVLALSDITVTTGASVNGRLLARNGAVTLDSNRVSVCSGSLVTAPPPTAPPATSAPPTTPTTPTSTAPAAPPTSSPPVSPPVPPLPGATASATPTAAPGSLPPAGPTASAPAAPAPGPPLPAPSASVPATPSTSATPSPPAEEPVPTQVTPAAQAPPAAGPGQVPQQGTGQVTVVPVGGVRAGDGSSRPITHDRDLLGLALLIVAVPFAFGFTLPRRRQT